MPGPARAAALAAVSFLFACHGLNRRPPDAVALCRWGHGPITLDGLADEDDWRGSRFLWDHEALYFFAEHDGDALRLFLKPAVDRPGAFEFHVTSAGSGTGLFVPGPGAEAEPAVGPEVRVRGSGARGWSVEGRVLWIDLLRAGGRPVPDERWAFSWGNAGPSMLRFERPEATARRPYGRERLLPLTTSRVRGAPGPPPPYRVRRLYPDLRIDFPVAVARQPGADRLLVLDEDRSWGISKLRRFADRPDAREIETLLEFDGTAYGLAFHPAFERNGLLFIGHNGPASAPGPQRKTRVSRYRMDPRPPYRLDPDSRRTIIEWPSDGHNGGDLAFGTDGMLFVTSGDGTSDSDTNVMGQGLDHLLAKVLRIDVDGEPYAIPPDNPFLATPGARPETWAYGLRNPWRIAVDPGNGAVWVGNNGQDLLEQVYRVERGANYGWSVMEGSAPFHPSRRLGPTPVIPPTAEHPHSESRSLTGGTVCADPALPGLTGAYLYGDFSTGKIWSIRHDGGRVTEHREIADTTLQITAFGHDTRGRLLILDHRADGGIHTLEPNPVRAAFEFPDRLSRSGLFRSVAGHVVEPALLPYSVNAPLWSDGTTKERYLALPGESPRIDVTPERGWGFPDGTVLVKSFALETEQRRRWVETRFLTRQEGEWIGVSYAWNDAGTEATLVEAGGMDRRFGPHTWRYPSRAECMVCHTRAANFVLGLSTLQVNREHDYGGVVDDQLRVLERLGILRVDWRTAALRRLRSRAAAAGEDPEAAVKLHGPAPGQREAPVSSMLEQSPESTARLVDPYDPGRPLAARARSYLHSNCAICHVEAGGGNASIDLEFATPRDRARIVDAVPLHQAFGIEGARLVAPGDPGRSVLLKRVSVRGPGQMPPLASSRVDGAAVELLREWILKGAP